MMNDYILSTPSHIFNLSCAGWTDLSDDLHIVYDVHFTDLEAYWSAINDVRIPKAPKDLLPLAVRYVSQDKTFYVIERPPFQTPVDFSGSHSYNVRKPIKIIQDRVIWVPWTITTINLLPDDTLRFHLYFNDGPMTSLDEKLVPSFYPNSSTGAICMGSDSQILSNMYKENCTITDIYNFFFNSYFSGWNCDIYNDIPEYDYLIKNLKIHQQIASQSGSKAAKFFDKPYAFNTKNNYTRMFLIMSHMNLSQMNDYILRIKTQPQHLTFSNSIKRYMDSLRQDTQQDAWSSQKYRPYYSYIDSLAIGNYTKYKRLRVVVSDYHKNLVHEYVSNPYLIYQIYKYTVEAHYNIVSTSPHFRYFEASQRFLYTHDELKPHMNSEFKDALSN